MDSHSRHALLSFTGDVRENLDRKRSVIAVSLDIEKALDTVWLTSLLYKLIKLRIPHSIVRLLYSYLLGRKFRVVIDDALSSEMPVTQGVPEGSVLGPILFTLYVSDLSFHSPGNVRR